MRSFKLFSSAALLGLSLVAGVQAADFDVSVRVGDPRYYGQIALDDRYQPRVIDREPVIIHRSRYHNTPIYLRVPPGHARQWSRYCGRYRACARPVLFVHDGWYVDHYRKPKHWRGHDHGYRHHRDHDRD